MTNRNRNNFFPRYFNLGDVNPDYSPSNQMRRSGDFYTRFGYSVLKQDNLLLNIGLTGFYRLSNDQYFKNYQQGYTAIKNTAGLAANGVIQFNYRFFENAEVSIYAGLPIVERKDAIDGLKRNYFITPGFKWSF